MLADWTRAHLREGPMLNGQLDEIFDRILNTSHTVFIQADQVAHFIQESLGVGSAPGQKKWQDISTKELVPQLHCLLPPGRYTWVEHLAAPVYGQQFPLREMGSPTHTATCLVYGPVNEELLDFLSADMGSLVLKYGATQALVCYHLMGSKRCSAPYRFYSFVFMYPDGTLMAHGETTVFCLIDKSLYESPEIAGCTDTERKELLLDGVFLLSDAFLRIPLMTLSLLNVKNVELQPHRPDRALQKKRAKLGHLPLVTAHTLSILTPGTRFVGRESGAAVRERGEPGEAASLKPLHLVRGHLADYRHGKGLFGRHKGVFWMPQHFRGSLDNGVVKKRYAVEMAAEGGEHEIHTEGL